VPSQLRAVTVVRVDGVLDHVRWRVAIPFADRGDARGPWRHGVPRRAVGIPAVQHAGVRVALPPLRGADDGARHAGADHDAPHPRAHGTGHPRPDRSTDTRSDRTTDAGPDVAHAPCATDDGSAHRTGHPGPHGASDGGPDRGRNGGASNGSPDVAHASCATGDGRAHGSGHPRAHRTGHARPDRGAPNGGPDRGRHGGTSNGGPD
jgi:hypothetical protein